MSQTPFFGVMSNQDGTYTDLFSGQTISDSDIKVRNMAPFYGRFIDKDGVEHDIRDISGGGSGGTVMWFDTISARDLYFTQHPTALKKGISVGVGNPVTAYTFNDTWITGALAFRGADGKDGKDGKIGPTGQAATIEVGAVTTGEPGTDAVVENVGTDTAAIFNIKIPRGKDGSGGGRDLPWVLGHTENRSLVANETGYTTPVYVDGDPAMLMDTKLIIPEDGVYILQVGRGQLTTTPTVLRHGIVHTRDGVNSIIAQAAASGGVNITSINAIWLMKKGDYLTRFINSSTASSSIVSAPGDALMNFYLARIL